MYKARSDKARNRNNWKSKSPQLKDLMDDTIEDGNLTFQNWRPLSETLRLKTTIFQNMRWICIRELSSDQNGWNKHFAPDLNLVFNVLNLNLKYDIDPLRFGEVFHLMGNEQKEPYLLHLLVKQM